MSAGSGLTACSNIQARLDRLWNTEGAGSFREPLPMLEFLLSDANKNGLQAEINGKGKTRTVDVVYYPRLSTSVVDSDQARTCTASDTIDDCSAQYTIDTTVNEQAQFTFGLDDLDPICEPNQDWFAQRVMQHVDVVARKVAEKTASQLDALRGEWNTHLNAVPQASLSADRKTFNVRTTLAASGVDGMKPYALALQQIRRAVTMSNFGPAVGFGGLVIPDMYAAMIGSGGVNEQGYDLAAAARQYGFAAQYDYAVAEQNSDHANKLWVMGVGANQLLQYTRYTGAFNEASDDTHKMGVIIDPMTGLEMDISIKRDCETIHTVITATTKGVSLPSDIYGATDDLSGANRFALVDVDNS